MSNTPLTVDEIFLHLLKKVEIIKPGKTYSWGDENQALYQLILTELIGEDATPSPTASDSAYHKTIGGNIARTFQRRTLAKLFNKGIK